MNSIRIRMAILMLLSVHSIYGQKATDSVPSKLNSEKLFKWKDLLNSEVAGYKGKNFSIKSNIGYDYRYYGLNYDGLGISPVSQNIYMRNEVTVYNLPLLMEFNYGNGYMNANKSLPKISIKFNPSQLLENYSEQLIAREKQKMIEELKQDTNYQKYAKNMDDLQYINQLFSDPQYIDQLSRSAAIVDKIKSPSDTIENVHNRLLEDAMNQQSKYKQWSSLKDSLTTVNQKLEMANPSFANYYQNQTLPIPAHPSQEQFMGMLRKSTTLPSYMKALGYINALEIGVIYPSANQMVFNGAAIRGMRVRLESKHLYTEVLYGKQLTLGSFFHDSLVGNGSKVFYTAAGYKNKYFSGGLSLYSYQNNVSADTSIFKYSFSAPHQSLIPGLELESRYKKITAYLKLNYSIEDIQGKEERYVNEVNNIGRPVESFGVSSFKNNMALIGGFESDTWRKGPHLSFNYKYIGNDYHSPSAPFTIPFNNVYELKAEQKFWQNKISLSVGATLRKNLMNMNTAFINDKSFSGFFTLNIKPGKKKPSLSIRYLPMYRTSVWKGELATLQMNQMSATLQYTRQVRKQMYTLVSNYTSQDIYMSAGRQTNRMVYIYQIFKPRKIPFQMLWSVNYFDKPISISKDSLNTLGTKFQVSYVKNPKLISSLYAEYSRSSDLMRKIIGMEWSGMQKYIGQIQCRLEYGTLIRHSGTYTKGFNIQLSIYRKLI